MRKRVILNIVCHSEYYGVQKSIATTAGGLDRARFRVIVAAPRGEIFFRELERLGVETREAPMSGPGDWRSALALRRIIQEEQVDLIHCHLGISSFLGMAAAWRTGVKARVASRHFLFRQSALRGNYASRAAMQPVYNWINGQCDRIVCVSDATRKAVAAAENIGPERLAVIYNPVAPVSAARRKRESGDGLFHVGALIRLSPEKGADQILALARLEKEEGGPIRYTIGGEGEDRARLQEQIDCEGLGEFIRLPGYIENLEEFFSGIDAFALPSRQESFGYALVEAMSAGAPVVTTRCGGPEEIVKHEETGLLAPVADAPAMRDALRRLASDAGLRQRLSENGAKRAREFWPEAIIPQVERLYEELLEGNSGPAK